MLPVEQNLCSVRVATPGEFPATVGKLPGMGITVKAVLPLGFDRVAKQALANTRRPGCKTFNRFINDREGQRNPVEESDFALARNPFGNEN